MFTVRPASLLCRFIAERASGRFSLASANSLDTRTPNSASSLQPPHFQPSPGGPLWCESQPHMVDVPSAQERVTANATPAEAMAWTNADSLVAERDGKKRGLCEARVKHGQGCQHPDRCTERQTPPGNNLLTHHFIFKEPFLCPGICKQENNRKALLRSP